MKNFIALLMAFFVVQLQANNLPTAEQKLESIHQICVPILFQHEINQQRLELSIEDSDKAIQAAITSCQESFNGLPAQEQKEIIATLNKITTIVELENLLTLLYDANCAGVILDFLQQGAIQEFSNSSLIAQALQAAQENKSYSEYAYEKLEAERAILESAQPEEIQAAIEMIQDPEQGQIALVSKIILGFFEPRA
jgi:hypothetical protein